MERERFSQMDRINDVVICVTHDGVKRPARKVNWSATVIVARGRFPIIDYRSAKKCSLIALITVIAIQSVKMFVYLLIRAREQ